MITITTNIDPTSAQSLAWNAGLYQAIATYLTSTQGSAGASSGTTLNPGEGIGAGTSPTPTPTPTPLNQIIP